MAKATTASRHAICWEASAIAGFHVTSLIFLGLLNFYGHHVEEISKIYLLTSFQLHDILCVWNMACLIFIISAARHRDGAVRKLLSSNKRSFAYIFAIKTIQVFGKMLMCLCTSLLCQVWKFEATFCTGNHWSFLTTNIFFPQPQLLQYLWLMQVKPLGSLVIKYGFALINHHNKTS